MVVQSVDEQCYNFFRESKDQCREKDQGREGYMLATFIKSIEGR